MDLLLLYGGEIVKISKEYGGIDYFRMIAALLVVAIHTSPLASINETADFILVRIIARVAVPFFFMTTGYFLFSDSGDRKVRLKSFLKKTGLIYAVAIMIYIPLNIYMGYFTKEFLIYEIIKDVLIDGTMYHLWYLPAVMLGVVLVWMLMSKLSLRRVFFISCILYMIGLFGDSYYGLTSRTTVMREVYHAIFMISDYTRNGIFYAPIFLIMGAMIAKNKKQLKLKINLLGLFACTILLVVEGLLLRTFQIMRHDSMYVMLIPIMYFLFHSILQWKQVSRSKFRPVSMIIFLIHPMVIVMLRGVAKLFELQDIIINQSIVYFTLVSFFSSVIAICVTLLLHKPRLMIKSSISKKMSRTWIEINIQNLKHNVNEIKKLMPSDCKMMAVVKANAYGHGAVMLSKYLNSIGVKSFAVATIDEGIELRKNGIQGDILILGYTDVTRADELSRYGFIQTIIDYEYGLMLNDQKKCVQVHIKIDTGMHRLGISVEDVDKIVDVFYLKNLKVSGIFTHLCVADSLSEEDVLYTKDQIDSFYHLLRQLEHKGITLPKIHIQSSYGLLNYPELHCDYARIGIALYGTLSSQGDRTRVQADLRPVLTLKTRVAMIKEVAMGEGVSYGRDFQVNRDSRIAILPIGYADGLPRNLADGSSNVLLHGVKVPIIGRICMDQLLIDITDMPMVRTGDVATLIGGDGNEEILAESIANNAGTITNELFSRIGRRMERVYI